MGKFVVAESKSSWHFNLKAANGAVIGSSESYSSEKACLNGIESVRKSAAAKKIEDQTEEGFKKETSPKFEIYEDKKGEFRFRLKASNGEIILVSEGYKAKASCKNGIESVIENADSPVEKA